MIRAAAQRIAAAVVVASGCGTVGATVDMGGGSSTGRAPVDDRSSAKELRRRCGIDDARFTAELRRDVGGLRTKEEDPGDGSVGVEDAVEGGLVVWGGVSVIRSEAVDASDEIYAREAPCGAALDGTF